MNRRVSLPAILCIGAVVLAGCGGSSPTTGVSASIGAKALPAIQPPAFIPGPLNGYSTPRAAAMRRPVAVVVENYAPDSRPQTGLAQASTVIETLAEGGVTRFMALYIEHDAAKVGPVRSTRMYFDDWAAAFHALLSHVGGNDDAQAALWHLPAVFNVDENRWEKSLTDTGTQLFWRSADRQVPHNVYTSTYKLRAFANANHQNWAYAQAYFQHKSPAPLAQRGRVGSISIQFMNPLYPGSNPDYAVTYRYDRRSDTYLRFMGGAPHIDTSTGRTLAPSNVVIMATGPAIADPAAGITPESILIPVTGTGTAWFFRDGHVAQGSWRQQNTNAPLRFFNRRGRPIAFNPGQTWIEVVPRGSPATWSTR